ncbi:MAG: PEGA domain-containing protein [Methanoregula sp.]
MKRFPFFVCLVFLLLLIQIGIVSAFPDTTTTTPGRTGGNIYFETTPPGATIWLDNVEIGTSPFMYYTEKTGTLEVRVQKRLYQDYSGTVTVGGRDRTDFYALLSPIPNDIMTQTPPATRVTTATIPEKKSTIIIPTPWPSSTPESPVDPAVVIGATTIGFWFMVIRRR